MISIRKYLDGPAAAPDPEIPPPHNRRSQQDLLGSCVEAYRAVVTEMGRCGADACTATGVELESSLLQAIDSLGMPVTPDSLAASSFSVSKQLQEWSRATGRHLQQKAAEVKGMLLAMAHTAESVGDRDKRCARQLEAVTTQLRRIATLDDISAMRGAIEKSAAELKSSIDRMTQEGRAALDDMQARVASFQARLEEAEETAARDTLTRLRSRLSVEGHLQQRIRASASFCVALLDIDAFKQVNDTYGHVIGDELLKQFSTELRSASRSSDIVGRWGGDEFIILLDCAMPQAQAQLERVSKWVCGNYIVEGIGGPIRLNLSASVGLAEYAAPETIAELLDRADAAMYSNKRSKPTSAAIR